MSEDLVSPARSRSASITAESNQDSAYLNRKIERVNKVWQCEACTMINQLKAKRCSICSTPQPISLSGQESINPSPFQAKAESSSQQPTEAVIEAESLYLELSEYSLVENLASSAVYETAGETSSSAHNDHQQITADDHWKCPHCTYNNSIKDKLCEICGYKTRAVRSANKPKPAPSVPCKNGHDAHNDQHEHDEYFDGKTEHNAAKSGFSSSSHDQHQQQSSSTAMEEDDGDDDESIQFFDNIDNNHEQNEDISDSSSSYDSNSDDDHKPDQEDEEDNDEEHKQASHHHDTTDLFAPQQHQESSSSYQQEKHQEQSDTWLCPQCTFLNAVGFKFCDVCGCQSPIKGKLHRDKAVRTQLRLQKSDRRKANAASKAAKKALREANQKAKPAAIKKEKAVVRMEEEAEDDSSSVMINDNESLVSQSNDKDGLITSASGVKRRRASMDNDYVSLSRKRQRKKSFLRRTAQEDDNSVQGSDQPQSASEYRPKKQSATTSATAIMTISKEERAQELKTIYEQQFDTPPAMKRGMAIIWHCSECQMVNRLKDETCAKCNHMQVAPYQYCALCTYFKAIEHRKAKRLAAEEGGEHHPSTSKHNDGRGTTPAVSSSSGQSRRGMLTAEFRRARDAAAEAAIPQFNRQPKVGPEYQLNPRALPQPYRFISTALDYSLYHDRLAQQDVDEISPWEYTNDLYEVLWMPPQNDDDIPHDFDAFLPKLHTTTIASADGEDQGENQVSEVVMDVVDAAVNLAIDGEIALLFKRHPVLSMQCLLQCNYNLALATELLPAVIAKYGNNGLDPHVISMDEEQLNVFEEAMIVHGNENWTVFKNELKQKFSVAELQDFYLIVWCQQYKERSVEAERQHRIYTRMSAASRLRRLKNKQRSDSEVNREDAEQGAKGSDDGSEETTHANNNNHQQEHDEDDDQQEMVHIDGGDMVSYFQVHSTAEQLSVVTCSIPPVPSHDHHESQVEMMDDSYEVEMKDNPQYDEAYVESSNSSNENDENHDDSTMDIEIVMVSNEVVTSSSHLEPVLSTSPSELSNAEADRQISTDAVVMDTSS